MWLLRLAFEVWETDINFLLGTHNKHLNVKELLRVLVAVSKICWKKKLTHGHFKLFEDWRSLVFSLLIVTVLNDIFNNIR